MYLLVPVHKQCLYIYTGNPIYIVYPLCRIVLSVCCPVKGVYYLNRHVCIHVGPHYGTGPVPALGPILVPVPALGHSLPQISTMPIWGAQFWNRAPHSGTENLILNLSATLKCLIVRTGTEISPKWASAKMGSNII